MTNSHLVVDGSNIATEGRTAPSLAQLDEAVRDFTKQHHYDNVVVIVDATFPNRIDAAERAEFEEAILAGELLTPPAGAVGRGDAFVLQIADRTGATILSNDSFQEFHGTYTWLFDEDRLWGGKPVPGVGWVFVPRVPVKGPVSRRAVRDAKRPAAKQPAARGTAAKRPARAAASEAPEADAPAKRSRSRRGPARKATTAATTDAAPTGRSASSAEPNATTTTGRRRRGGSSEPINEPATFLAFVTNHQPGSTVEATVVEFSSHGAYVEVDGARCYVPLKSMGDPPPRSAREVLSMGEVCSFIVQGFDTPRRGIDLALPGAGAAGPGSSVPTDADSGADAVRDGEADEGANRPPPRAEEASVAAAKKKAPAKKKAAAKKAPAKKAPAKKAPAKKAPARKAPARKAPAKKAPAKKAPAKKAPAKKAPAKKAPAKKAPARKAPAKKAPAKKAPAKKAPAKKAPARKAPAKKAPARKAPAKKAPAKKAPARKAPAKKAPARKAAR